MFDIVNKQGTVVGEKPVVPSSSVQLQQEMRSAERTSEASGQRPSSTLVVSVFFPLRPFVRCFLAVPFFPSLTPTPLLKVT